MPADAQQLQRAALREAQSQRLRWHEYWLYGAEKHNSVSRVGMQWLVMEAGSFLDEGLWDVGTYQATLIRIGKLPVRKGAA